MLGTEPIIVCIAKKYNTLVLGALFPSFFVLVYNGFVMYHSRRSGKI